MKAFNKKCANSPKNNPALDVITKVFPKMFSAINNRICSLKAGVEKKDPKAVKGIMAYKPFISPN